MKLGRMKLKSQLELDQSDLVVKYTIVKRKVNDNLKYTILTERIRSRLKIYDPFFKVYDP